MKRFLVVWLSLLGVLIGGARAARADSPLGGRTAMCANPTPDAGCPCCRDQPGCGCGCSCDGSLLTTVNMAWVGEGIDYATAAGETGCKSCGGKAPKIGKLPSLEIHRYHRYRDVWFPSSLGPGSFLNYDITLTLMQTDSITGGGVVMLLDPLDTSYRNLRDDGNGVYTDTATSAVHSLTMLDAASQPVHDQAAAVSAVLLGHKGEQYVFEIIQVDGNRYGRLVQELDRNGNAITLSYQFPPDASDAALGFDRRNLWKIASVTDAYGRQATFTYTRVRTYGPWVVSQIDLPNGQHVTYTYDDPSLQGLSGVIHPDGTTTTLSTTQDATYQMTVLHYFDAAAEGTHRKKDVYLTNPTWVDPATSQVYSQSANLARQLVNGAGEVSYQITGTVDAATNHSVYYVYDGGLSFHRFTTDLWGGPVALDHALDGSLGQDPSTFTYQQDTAYEITTYRRRLAETDLLGRRTATDRDLITGAVTKTTFPDGSVSTSTYNPFVEPLVEVDQLGRKTQYVYDAHGNKLSKTAAVGTPDQAIWSWTYNAKGQPLTATDANGHVTDYAYTPEGYLASVTEPPDTVGGPRAMTQYAYDVAGRLTSTTHPMGRVTAYAYDARNRVIAITYDDATVEQHVYGTGADANLLVQKVDRLGNVEAYAYDGQGRETQRVLAFGRPEAVSRNCTYLVGTNLKSVCVDRGERTAYGYDAYNRLVSTTVQPNAATTLTDSTVYDADRRVDYRQDRYGRRTFQVYDLNNRLIRTVQELMPGAVNPPAGQAARDTYLSGLSRILTANAPYLIEEMQYDAAGQVVARLDGRGISKTFAYDAQKRPIREIEAAGTPEAGKTEHDYDPQGNVIRTRHPRHFTEPGGFLTQYAYTGRNLLASTTWALGRPEQAVESYGYDLDRRRSLRVDARGHAWNTLWCLCCGYHQAEIDPAADVDGNANTPDTRGIHVGNRDSLNHVTHEYVAMDAAALPSDAERHAPAGTLKTTTTRYDGLYRPVAKTAWMVEIGAVDENSPPIAGDPGYPASWGLTTRWVYDDDLTDGAGLDAAYAGYLGGLGFGPGSDGSAVAVTNPAGETTVTVYDGLRRVVLTIDGVGNTTATGYDAPVTGLIEMARADGLGHVKRLRADGDGRVRVRVDADGFVTANRYDAAGNLISVRDPNGVGYDAVFDARGREVARTDMVGDTTGKGYDAEGNQVAVTDGLGHTSAMAYDGRHRKVASTDRLSATTVWAYDANGNLVSLTDAEGGVTSYQFDPRNRQVVETFPDNGSRVYAYDAAGRLLSRLDQAGDVTQYHYDRADRLVLRAYPDGLDDTFTYDAAGRMTSAVSARYANTVGRAYDAAGRQVLESLKVGGQTYDVGYGYDAAGRQVMVSYPDGSVVDRAYTASNQLASVAYGGALVAAFSYDPGGRRIGMDYGNGLHETRAYRADNRIASIAVPGVTGFGYSYDANKNPLSQANSVNASDGQAYGYDAEDRLATFARSNGDAQSWDLSPVGDWRQFTVNGVTESRGHNAVHELTIRDGAAQSYDARGNLTQDDQGSTFAWDYESLMSGATVSGNAAQYAYDALRRRVSKTVGGSTMVFAYDGWRAIAEYAGGTPASPQRAFVFGEYLDEALVMVTGGQRYWYHANQIFSVQGITDGAGTVVEAYWYDPYGKATVLTGPGADGVWFTGDEPSAGMSTIGNPYTYTSQRFDGETRYMYFKNRYYGPTLGRFLSRDPINYEGSPSWNLYDYVSERTTTTTDPLGEKWLWTVLYDCNGNVVWQGYKWYEEDDEHIWVEGDPPPGENPPKDPPPKDPPPKDA